jgi:sulfate permease, SulP family
LVSSSTEPIHTVIVDLDANDELDIISSEQLDKRIQAVHAQAIRVGLAHVHGPALDMARRSGVLDQVGAAHIFPTVAAAVAWAQSGARDQPPDPAG